jgi:hypothetical protein
MWRLRSLAAMGHDTARLARALGISPRTASRLLAGRTATVTPELARRTRVLWDAWWDKTPPANTPARRRAAAAARRAAARNGWCQPLALDEDELDRPGYRPYSRWRPAAGTGTAPDPGDIPGLAARPAATSGTPATTRPDSRPAGPAPRRTA